MIGNLNIDFPIQLLPREGENLSEDLLLMGKLLISIGNAQFSKTLIKANESVELTIPVSNTGKRNGTEIVQVYVRKMNDTDGPLETLKGFQRVNVAAGKTGQAVINLPYAAFEFFDRASGKMTVTAGEFKVLYGNCSDAKDLKTSRITISK